MEKFPFLGRKKSAQAMVEFAIALPILLLLLYVILEAGRYVFIYSSIVTASRQAVRYGSATGAGGDFTTVGGPNNTGYARYQDCFGIRRAAATGAYVARFEDVLIEWDGGPADTTPTEYCSAGNSDTSLTSTILSDNSHRIRVTITEPYIPLLPRLVPFIQRDIVATSSRTILLSVSIEVTAATTLNNTTPTQPTTTFTPS